MIQKKKRKKLHPNCRSKYRGYCPNCAKKWRGYWELYFGIGNNTSGSGSHTFRICPHCNYHFELQVPQMPDRTLIPFGEEG